MKIPRLCKRNTALPDPYPSSRQERLRDGYDSTPDPASSCLRCSAQKQTATWLLNRVLHSLLAGCSVCHFAHARPTMPSISLVIFINPRRACAARVTVVVLSFCLSVCLLPRFLPLRATRRPISDTDGFSAILAFFLNSVFCKNAAFESYGVKRSEGANMQISTGLPRPGLRTLEAPEVAMQGER